MKAADLLGRHAVAAARAGDHEQPATGEAIGSRPWSRNRRSERWKWIIAGAAVADRRVHRLPVLRSSGRTRCPRASRRATAGSRAKLVDVSAKEPLRVKEILVDEGALVKPGQVLVRLDTVTLESRAGRGERQRPGRGRRSWRSPGPSSSSRRARSTSPDVEADALEAAGRSRAPARSASWTCAPRRWRRRRPASPRPRRCWQTADAERRGRARERGDDPDAHRRRDAARRRSRAGCSTGWRSRARCWRRAARR